MPIRIIASLASFVVLLWYFGQDRIEYFYFDIANGEVDTADWQKPKVWFYTGDKVPLKTKIDWNGQILQFLNVNQCCVPFLEIRSPVPLSNMIVTNGKFVSDYDDLLGASCVAIHRRGEDTAQLSWIYWPEFTGEPSCIRIGDEISIKFVPENGSEPLVVSAALVRSGYYSVSSL